jgi:hypothetical protein
MRIPVVSCVAAAVLILSAAAFVHTAPACEEPPQWWLLIPVSAPSANALSGAVTLEAQASAELQPKIKFADILLDAKPFAVIETAPYRVIWDTTKVSDGVHYLQARAHLTDGVIIGTPLKKVIVGNAPAAAPSG